MSTVVKLKSSNKKVFEVPQTVAEMSITIKNMLQDVDNNDINIPIMLPNVTAKILSKVLDWANYHHKNVPEAQPAKDDGKKTKPASQEISPWDKDFCDVDQPTLFELILAANYLDIKELLDLTCKTVANMIKGKSPEDIHKTFNIKNDFTPEEEEQIRKENKWCKDL